MDSPSTSNPQRPTGREGLPRAYEVRSERERVLEAVVKMSAAKGYEATTVADVVEFAGISQETFDEMFEGKEACFLEAYEAVFDVLVAHVTAAFEAASEAALAGADRRRAGSPGRAALDGGRHRPDGDGRGDRRGG